MNKIIIFCVIISVIVLCRSESNLEKPVFLQDGIYQEPRIFYGYVAQARQFPHMCSLLNRKTTGSYTLCGGSLISEKHILTAAHCVSGVASTTVGCGSIDRNKPYLQVQSSSFVSHPQYNPSTLNNDIAIWTLPISVTYDCEYSVLTIIKSEF